MRSGLAVDEETVADQRPDNDAGSKGSERAVINSHGSTVTATSGSTDTSTDPLGAASAISSPMLGQAGDDHLDDGFEIGEGLLGRRTPGGPATPDQCRTIGVPTIIVRLDDDFEGVGGHVVTLSLRPDGDTRLLDYHTVLRACFEKNRRATLGSQPSRIRPLATLQPVPRLEWHSVEPVELAAKPGPQCRHACRSRRYTIDDWACPPRNSSPNGAGPRAPNARRRRSIFSICATCSACRSRPRSIRTAPNTPLRNRPGRSATPPALPMSGSGTALPGNTRATGATWSKPMRS